MEPLDACTPWTGRINAQGYGTFGAKLAHRKTWEEERGEIPPGMTLDHTCHDPRVCRLGPQCPHRRCVNVAHLELCTAADNKTRGSIGFLQSEKVECPEGHPYSGDNLLMSGGKRLCRECRRTQLRARRDRAKRQKCAKAGHEFAPVMDSEGREYCGVCRAATAREVGVANKRTHCPQGHAYEAGNVYTSAKYVRCRECNREAMARRGLRRQQQHLADRGHPYLPAEDVNGKLYCSICRKANSGPKRRTAV